MTTVRAKEVPGPEVLPRAPGRRRAAERRARAARGHPAPGRGRRRWDLGGSWAEGGRRTGSGKV